MATRISEETRQKVRAAWPDILARLAAGELVRDALATHGLSDPVLRAYKLEDNGRRAEWDEAREASADAFMDEAIATANNPKLDSGHARVKVDTLKWAARIRNPRLYSDKTSLDVNVRTIDLTRIIGDAQARLAAAQVGRVIDGQVLRVALPAELESLM